jgi:hypothetical protein
VPEQITEARPTIEGTPGATGRIEVTLITPGWGSSGWYSAEILEQAAADGVFPAGLHLYVDHPSQRELHDRPERSVRDLAAVLTEAARWDGSRLVAEAQLLGAHAETFRQPEMAEAIGVSIRASADVTMGEADGRRGRIIGRLVEAQSVDFVTRAGRGGRYQVIESATPSHVARQAVQRGVAEATVNELRERLQQALRDAYGGEKSWVWLRDFDTDHVWYEHETDGSSGLFQHAYSEADAAVTLTGDPVEVRIETRYVPVTPAEANPTPTPTEESLMPQIEEGRLAQLEEAAGRVTALEAERDAARAALAESTARQAARARVAAKVAESQVLTPRTQARVVESIVAALPVAEGAVADDALAAAVEAAVKDAEAEYPAQSAPASGSLFGTFGSVTESATGGTADLSESAFKTAVGSPFGRKGA